MSKKVDKKAEKPVEAEAPKATEPEKPVEATPEKPAEPDWKELYARTLADFDNYKKRAIRDREETYRFVQSEVILSELPAVDNLDLALKNAKNPDDEFVKGVKLVYDSLLKTLADHGAKPMGDLVGKEPDPNLHEAIAKLPNEEVDEGRIAAVVKTGWMLGERLLRAAQVVVSAGKQAK